MNANNLKVIQNLVYKLVDIANGSDKQLTPVEAKLAVKIIDLTEGYIATVPDEYIEPYTIKDNNKIQFKKVL